MAKRPEQRPSWRSRLQVLLHRERDVIVAEIGPGAQDVIVGKNIIRIGSLVVPALPAIVALLATLALAAFLIWWITVPARMGEDTFNVAVAEFGQIRQGRVEASTDGQIASRTLFTTLRAELEAKAGTDQMAEYRPLVWHDSMSFLQKRAVIGMVQGADAEARRQAACARARELNVTIFVYGYLNLDSSPPTLEQEFCVRTPKQDLGDIAEVESTNRVGMPVPVDLPLSGTVDKAAVNTPLRIRNTLMTQIVIGLSYEITGRYTRAQEIFQDALAHLESSRSSRAAPGSDGEDVVHYFIGREYFFLGQNPAQPLEAKINYFSQAQNEFELALVNPAYLRARLALGSTFYQRAQLLAQQQQPFESEIKRAIAEQTQVLREASPSDNRSVLVQDALSLGLSHWLDGYRLLQAGDQPAAQAAFGWARQYAEFGRQWSLPDEHRFTAAAHMIDGLTYDYAGQEFRRRGEPEAAEQFRQAGQAYAACVDQGKYDSIDAFLNQHLIGDTCKPSLARVRALLASS
jgi:hypothetical protein